MQPSPGGLEGLVRASLRRWQVPGAVVGVLAEGRSEVLALGVADLESGAPLEADATLRIASVTKPFTAALALSLAADGLLDLDETVPGPLAAEGVTVRHLLAHLGGLEGELGDMARFGEGDDALPRAVAELGSLRRLAPPGRYWSYCNAGYWAVGALAAERTGTTYEEALRQRVLAPLGLARTSFAEPEARGHEQPEPGVARHVPARAERYPPARRPSGGLTSTAADLLRFAEAHLARRAPFRLAAPEAETASGRYGLGWAVEDVDGAQVWSHDGSYGGFRSRLALVPGHDAAFAILTNGDAGEALIREVGDGLLEARWGLRRREPPTVEPPEGELEALAGRYTGGELEAGLAARNCGVVVDGFERDVRTGERRPLPPVVARPVGSRRFAVSEGQWRGARFDVLPESGPPEFLRLAGRLLPRV